MLCVMQCLMLRIDLPGVPTHRVPAVDLDKQVWWRVSLDYRGQHPLTTLTFLPSFL